MLNFKKKKQQLQDRTKDLQLDLAEGKDEWLKNLFGKSYSPIIFQSFIETTDYQWYKQYSSREEGVGGSRSSTSKVADHLNKVLSLFVRYALPAFKTEGLDAVSKQLHMTNHLFTLLGDLQTIDSHAEKFIDMLENGTAKYSHIPTQAECPTPRTPRIGDSHTDHITFLHSSDDDSQKNRLSRFTTEDMRDFLMPIYLDLQNVATEFHMTAIEAIQAAKTLNPNAEETSKPNLDLLEEYRNQAVGFSF